MLLLGHAMQQRVNILLRKYKSFCQCKPTNNEIFSNILRKIENNVLSNVCIRH